MSLPISLSPVFCLDKRQFSPLLKVKRLLICVGSVQGEGGGDGGDGADRNPALRLALVPGAMYPKRFCTVNVRVVTSVFADWRAVDHAKTRSGQSEL